MEFYLRRYKFIMNFSISMLFFAVFLFGNSSALQVIIQISAVVCYNSGENTLRHVFMCVDLVFSWIHFIDGICLFLFLFLWNGYSKVERASRIKTVTQGCIARLAWRTVTSGHGVLEFSQSILFLRFVDEILPLCACEMCVALLLLPWFTFVLNVVFNMQWNCRFFYYLFRFVEFDENFEF